MKKMILLEAAEVVLEEAKMPLHIKEIIKIAKNKELIAPKGKTPWDALRVEITRNIEKNPKNTIFFKEKGSPVFGLRKYSDDLPETATEHNMQKQQSLIFTKDKNLTFIQSAERVLREQKEELHYADITEQAIKKGFLASQGQTPSLSMNAVLIRDIQKKEDKDEKSVFLKIADRPGYFGLSEWGDDDKKDDNDKSKKISEQKIDNHKNEIKEQLRGKLLKMKGDIFEEFVSEHLLPTLGFAEIQKLGGKRDGGIDAIGIMVVKDSIQIKFAVQAKGWKDNIQAPAVQNLRGALDYDMQGIIMTTSGFSSGAKKEACAENKKLINLIDCDDIIELMMDNKIGVEQFSKSGKYVIDEDFFLSYGSGDE